MSPDDHNLNEYKSPKTPAADDSWEDDDKYRLRQEHGRQTRVRQSEDAADRRSYYDKVL